MYTSFMKFFNLSDYNKTDDNYFLDFLRNFGGMQLNGGLFNVMKVGEILKWEKLAGEMFPDMKGAFRLFAYDWLGRFFGIDLRKGAGRDILIFDPATLEISAISCTFKDFVNKLIPERSDLYLLSESYDNWVKYSGAALPQNSCVGYKVPLFLSGEESFDNMEASDLDVYWTLMAQLANSVQGLEDGTVIDKFTIE